MSETRRSGIRGLVMLLALVLCGPAASQTIALVADFNGSYGSIEYDRRVMASAAAIIEGQADFVLSAGDMVAGQKRSLEDARFAEMWAAFDRAFADALHEAGIPILVSPGNHDASRYAGFERERAAFREHWGARTLGFELLPGSEWPDRYAARIGDAVAVSFNGTRPGRLDNETLAFVESMLERYATDRSATLVMSHLPMWPLADGRETQVLNDPELLALLHRYGVDAYISGHHHVFYAGVDSAGMLHLSVSPVGGGTRRFAAQSRRQPLGLTWLEVRDRNLEPVALVGPAFQRPMAFEALPETVSGPLGVLHRVDGAVPLRSASDTEH